ncbi:MAG: CBS domain-containing protein [Myxococcales bacterium]
MNRPFDPTRMRDVMVRAEASVRHSEPLRVAANRLERSSADAVVVRFDEGTIAGLLTERDIVLGAQSEAEGFPGHAGWYASKRFVLAHETESLDAVLHRLETADARRAVVIDRKGRPIGLFSMYIGIHPESVADDGCDPHREQPERPCACC